MQKKLLPKFIPPRVLKGAGGWVITWYELNPATGELERFRKTFSLNRIPNKAQRAERARAIMQEITQALAAGGYIYGGHQPAGEQYTPIKEALAIALKIKMQYLSGPTQATYKSITRIFGNWLDSQRLASWPVIRFGKREAMAFLDHVRLQRRVGEQKHNNYIMALKSIFGELLAREYIQANPWDKVPKLRVPKKRRRNFSQQERRTVAAWIEANNPGLFRAVLLSYYCFIRPNEMRQMQIGCIDLAASVIRLPAEITKADKDRTVTLPAAIFPYFEDLKQYQPTLYLFARGLKPGKKPANKNAINKLHREALERLFASGSIKDMSGLSFYSWKDSGLTDLSENISLLELMKQAGHSDPKMTMKYIHEKPAEKIRRLEKDIF